MYRQPTDNLHLLQSLDNSAASVLCILCSTIKCWETPRSTHNWKSNWKKLSQSPEEEQHNRLWLKILSFVCVRDANSVETVTHVTLCEKMVANVINSIMVNLECRCRIWAYQSTGIKTWKPDFLSKNWNIFDSISRIPISRRIFWDPILILDQKLCFHIFIPVDWYWAHNTRKFTDQHQLPWILETKSAFRRGGYFGVSRV